MLAALNAACVELSIELADAETIPDMPFRSAANARYKCLIEPYANGSARGKICVVFDFAKLRGRVVDRQVKMSKAP